MATANNCNVPEDLWYWVREHVWARLEADGSVTIGMTATQRRRQNRQEGKNSGTRVKCKWVPHQVAVEQRNHANAAILRI
jgi:hypothetical protein